MHQGTRRGECRDPADSSLRPNTLTDYVTVKSLFTVTYQPRLTNSTMVGKACPTFAVVDLSLPLLPPSTPLQPVAK